MTHVSERSIIRILMLWARCLIAKSGTKSLKITTKIEFMRCNKACRLHKFDIFQLMNESFRI